MNNIFAKHDVQISPNKRFGLNLVELMIVLVIIVLLASISAGVVFKLVQAQKKSTTENTVKLLQNAINRITTSTTSTARQDYLKRNKYFYQLIANDLSKGQAAPPVAPLLGIIDPIRAGELVYVNTQIARTFPQHVIDFKPVSSGDKIKLENDRILPPGFPPNKPIVYMDFAPENSTDTNVKKFISERYNQNNERFPLPAAVAEFEAMMPGFYTLANKAIEDPPIEADMQTSACLYFAIASHPEGLKKDELKSSISYFQINKGGTDFQLPFLSDGSGKPIYFKLTYKDSKAPTGKVEKEIPQGSLTMSLVYDQGG